MPKRTVDELIGYHIAFDEITVPVTDNGQLIRDAHGDPKIQRMLRLQFLDPTTGHQIIASWPIEFKQELIANLTGVTIPNIVIPNGATG